MKKFLLKYIQNKFVIFLLYYFIKIYFLFIGNILFSFSKRYASFHTRILKFFQWSLSISPSHYDHEINLYNWIYDSSLSQFAEAGVFSRALIKKGDKILDLCSGVGFYSYLFLSDLGNSVDAIDFNKPDKKYLKKNINFINANILDYKFKKDNYDIVVFCEAVAYFSENQKIMIFEKIQKTLKNKGTLYIRTPLELSKNKSANQINNVVDKKIFENSFKPYFDIKYQVTTEYDNRTYLNYYLKIKEK